MTIADLSSQERRWLYVVAGLAGAISVLFFGADYTVDGLTYAVRVETGRHLWHANHMLPNYIWWLLHHGLNGAGWSVRAVVSMQAFNAAMGLAACIVLYGVLRQFCSVRNGVLLIALVFFSFGWWSFSHEPEVYVPALALICFQLPGLLRDKQPGWGALSGLIILCATTIGFHQQHVLWYFVALALLAMNLGSWKDRRWLVFAVSVPALVIALYVVLGLQHGAFESLQSMAEWFLGLAYSEDAGVSTHRAAAAPLHRLALALAAAGNLLLPWTLVAQPVWVIAVALLAILALLVALIKAAWNKRGQWGTQSTLACLLLAWMAVYFFFALVWEARNVEFMLPLLLPAALLSAIVIGQRPSRLLTLAVVLLVGLNMLLSHVPDSRLPLRYQLALAVDDRHDLGPRDGLITEEKNTVLYLNYMRDKSVRFIPGAVSHAMHVNVETAQFERQFRTQLQRLERVYTLELATRGRLYWMAKRMPWVSENKQRDIGALEARLYRSMTKTPVDGLDDVWRVEPRRGL